MDFKNYKNSSLKKPRDEAWDNWKAWSDDIGDNVKGHIVDAFYRPAEGMFKEQRGITLKQEDDKLINVGIKYLPYVLSATDDLRIGDPLVMELTEIKEPSKKGYKGAKIFSFYGENIKESEGNKTVRQLTEEDKAKGGSVSEPVVETTEEEDFENTPF